MISRPPWGLCDRKFLFLQSFICPPSRPCGRPLRTQLLQVVQPSLRAWSCAFFRRSLLSRKIFRSQHLQVVTRPFAQVPPAGHALHPLPHICGHPLHTASSCRHLSLRLTSLYKRGGAISETPTVNVFRSGQVFLSSLWGWVTLSNRFVEPSEVERALANATVEVSFTIHHTYIKNKDESVEQDPFKAKIEQLLVHIEKKKHISTVVSNPSLPTNP